MRLTGGPPDCWASGSTLLTTLLQCHCVVLYSVHNISVGFHLRSYILSTSPHEYACSILYIPAIRDLHSWLLPLLPPPCLPPSTPPPHLSCYCTIQANFPPYSLWSLPSFPHRKGVHILQKWIDVCVAYTEKTWPVISGHPPQYYSRSNIRVPDRSSTTFCVVFMRKFC